MNANEMTFGVEIETVAPNSAVENDGLRIGAYHHGIQVPYLPEGWKAERDGSIDTRGGGQACEIVSPILRGAEGLAQDDARILHCMMHVDVQVAPVLDFEVEAAVPGETVEHVVEKPDAGGHDGAPYAVEINPHPNVRFLGVSNDFG